MRYFIKFYIKAFCFACVIIVLLGNIIAFGANYQAYRTVGQEQIKDGTYQEALESLRKAYRLNPKDVKTIDLMGIAFMKMGRNQEALESFRKTVMLEPGYFPGFYHMGKLYEKTAKTLQKAIHMYKKALSLNPDFDLANNAIGKIYFRKKEFAKAKIYFERLLEQYPNNESYLDSLSQSLLKTGDYKKAISVLLNLLKQKPKNSRLLNSLGKAYLKQGDMDKARHFYTRAIKAFPGSVESICNLGELEKMEGNVVESINHFKSAISIDPNFARAYYMLGKSYAVMDVINPVAEGKHSKYLQMSIDALYDALSIEKYDPNIYYQQGLNFFRKKDHQKALSLLEEAHNLDKDSVNITIGFAKACLAQGRFDKAESVLQNLVENNRSNHEAVLALGEIYAENGNYSEARHYYLRALKINPRSRRARSKLNKLSNRKQ